MPVMTFIIAGIGAVGFVLAIISLMRKDKAIFLLLPIITGALILLWTGAELLMPH